MNGILIKSSKKNSGFAGKIYQIFAKKEILTVLHKLFKKRRKKKEKRNFPTHSIKSAHPNTKARQKHHRKSTDQYPSQIQTPKPSTKF